MEDNHSVILVNSLYLELSWLGAVRLANDQCIHIIGEGSDQAVNVQAEQNIAGEKILMTGPEINLTRETTLNVDFSGIKMIISPLTVCMDIH